MCSLTLEPPSHAPPLPPPPFPHPIPLLCVVTDHWVELLVLYGNFLLASYFTNGDVCVSMLLSQFIPCSPSLTVSTSPFFMSASLSCLQIGLSVPFF